MSAYLVQLPATRLLSLPPTIDDCASSLATDRRVASAVHSAVWDTRAVEDERGWTALRDAWLGGASAALSHDPRVAGWGLVGSFGRGEADDWSDVDLLVLVHDADFRAFVDPELNELWSKAQLLVDARRNAPIGATSVATLCVRSGLPIVADWYVYPSSMGAWPNDCQVMRGADVAPRTSTRFAEWNGRGPRNQPVDISPTRGAAGEVGDVPDRGEVHRPPIALGGWNAPVPGNPCPEQRAARSAGGAPGSSG